MNKKNVIKKTACYLLSGLTVLSSGGNFLAQGTVDDSIKPGTVQNVKLQGKKSSLPYTIGGLVTGVAAGLLGGYTLFGKRNGHADFDNSSMKDKLDILYEGGTNEEFAKVRALYEANPNVNVGENYYISNINYDLPVTPPYNSDNHITEFTLVNQDSLAAGINLAERHNVDLTQDHDVAVLNFGNAQRPGGSVARTGPNAQEEALCCSTFLFYALAKAWCQNIFYTNNLMLRGAIDNPWKPNVICTSKEDFETHRRSIAHHGVFSRNVPILCNNRGNLSISNQNMNFLTFAAPKVSGNLYDKHQGEWSDNLKNELHRVMYRIFMNIYFGAAYYGIRKLVIGAIGCGVFNCDPNVVAEAARKVWDDYNHMLNASFDEIVIAVKTNNPSQDRNYQAFAQQFRNLINPRQQAYNGD